MALPHACPVGDGLWWLQTGFAPLRRAAEDTTRGKCSCSRGRGAEKVGKSGAGDARRTETDRSPVIRIPACVDKRTSDRIREKIGNKKVPPTGITPTKACWTADVHAVDSDAAIGGGQETGILHMAIVLDVTHMLPCHVLKMLEPPPALRAEHQMALSGLPVEPTTQPWQKSANEIVGKKSAALICSSVCPVTARSTAVKNRRRLPVMTSCTTRIVRVGSLGSSSSWQ